MKLPTSTGPLRGLSFLFGACGFAAAQSYQFASNQIPQGNPFNNSFTENVDFADVDLDGDMDAVNADGGDCCNDQNRLWINLGFAQAGTIGFFEDQTATRFPNVTDPSRDADFVDVDGDGDADLHNSNHSQINGQPNRFWINQGGLQGASTGFFVDETLARWRDLGVNDGASQCSSIASYLVLSFGGFIDWTGDSVFGDFDNDGDLDLLHSTYGASYTGNIPQRVFLNDGLGNFAEHNPSCHQLPDVEIPNGAPALWAQGTQLDLTFNSSGASADIDNTPTGVELGDIDADFDIDFLIGSRNSGTPRLFSNMRVELGHLVWRDVTFSQITNPASGSDNYEQEFGDMDGDGDYDIYGLNWPGLNDAVYANNGSGTFGVPSVLPGSGSDDEEGDWIDFNADGNLDLIVGNFSGQEKLYQGNGTPTFTLVPLPGDVSTTRGLDGCDIDLDGDYDILVGNDSSQANALLLNVTQIPDAIAANLPHLEQVLDRPAGPPPTRVRVHVYDNASWDVLRYNATVLEYEVDGGPTTSIPMIYAGGQLFLGAIPGVEVGTITYRVRSTDEHGNSGLSATKSYVSFITDCFQNIANYCTGKLSSSGCHPAITATGYASLGLPGELSVTANQLETDQNALAYFGTTGPASLPFQDGTLCVNAPLYRLAIKNTLGQSACTGAITYGFNEFLLVAGGPLFMGGQSIHVQAWFRDPAASSTTGLTGGVTFVVCP